MLYLQSNPTSALYFNNKSVLGAYQKGKAIWQPNVSLTIRFPQEFSDYPKIYYKAPISSDLTEIKLTSGKAENVEVSPFGYIGFATDSYNSIYYGGDVYAVLCNYNKGDGKNPFMITETSITEPPPANTLAWKVQVKDILELGPELDFTSYLKSPGEFVSYLQSSNTDYSKYISTDLVVQSRNTNKYITKMPAYNEIQYSLEPSNKSQFYNKDGVPITSANLKAQSFWSQERINVPFTAKTYITNGIISQNPILIGIQVDGTTYFVKEDRTKRVNKEIVWLWTSDKNEAKKFYIITLEDIKDTQNILGATFYLQDSNQNFRILESCLKESKFYFQGTKLTIDNNMKIKVGTTLHNYHTEVILGQLSQMTGRTSKHHNLFYGDSIRDSRSYYNVYNSQPQNPDEYLPTTGYRTNRQSFSTASTSYTPLYINNKGIIGNTSVTFENSAGELQNIGFWQGETEDA